MPLDCQDQQESQSEPDLLLGQRLYMMRISHLLSLSLSLIAMIATFVFCSAFLRAMTAF